MTEQRHPATSRAPWRGRPGMLLWAAVVGFSVLELGASALRVASGADPAWHLALAALSTAAVIATPLRLWPGILLALVPVASMGILPGQTYGLTPMLVTTIVACLRRPPGRVAALVAGYAGVLASATQVGSSLHRVGVWAAVLVAGVVAGLTVRWLAGRSRRAADHIATLEQRVANVRREERTSLAGELSALLADGLAVTRQALTRAAVGDDDAAILATLREAQATTRTSLTRLRQLVSALRSALAGPAGDTAPDTAPEVATTIGAAVDDAEDLLVGNGFPVEVDLPASLVDLPNDLVALCVKEATDLALTTAVPGGCLRIAVGRDGAAVTLEVLLPTLGAEAPASTPLRALAERLARVGGALTLEGRAGELALLARVPAVPAVRPDGAATPDVAAIPDAAASTSGMLSGPGSRQLRLPRGTMRLLIRLPALVGLAMATTSAISHLLAGDELWHIPALWAGLCAGVLVVPWSLPWSMGVLVATLAGGLVSTQAGASIAHPVTATSLVLAGLAAFHRPISLLVVAAGWAGYCFAWYHGQVTSGEWVSSLATPLLALPIGLGARSFVQVRSTQLAELTRLRAAEASARQQERSLLAGELHDVVAHQLSLIGMQVMAVRDDADLSVLRRTAAQVARICAAAQSDLTTLVHLMREHEDAPTSTPHPGTSDGWVRPTSAAAAVAATLREAGHRVELAVDPDADDCDPTTERTVSRILREATTNILRYAPPHAACSIEVTTTRAGVDVLVTNPLPDVPTPSPDSTGWGLLGLTERSALTGGTFSAGPDAGAWRVEAHLPRWVGAPRPRAASVSPRPVAETGDRRSPVGSPAPAPASGS